MVKRSWINIDKLNFWCEIYYIERTVIKVKDIIISDDIIYIGADDKDIELFENQYNVPNGVAYNSYIIIDKKIAINNRYNW